MNRDSFSSHLTGFVRIHERALVAVFLIGFVVSGGIVSLAVVEGRIRGPALERVEQIVDYWDDRWTRRLEYGEGLVNAQAYQQAVEYLVPLDRAFPAQHVKHKRDGERERLLRSLGRSYSELGKKRLALDTYRRLVEFDPRNFENHYLLAQASLRFGEPDMAQAQFAGVLKIHPTHMPSVRAYLTSHFEKGNFAAVVAAYETYLNAFLTQVLTVTLGQSSTRVGVPVDGRFHDLDIRLSSLPESSAELMFQVGELSVQFERVVIKAPLLVGEAGPTVTQVWPGPTSWRGQEMEPIGVGSFRPQRAGAALQIGVPPNEHGVAGIHLRLRLFKPVDPELWDVVQKSYQNLLRYDDLRAALERSVISITNDAVL